MVLGLFVKKDKNYFYQWLCDHSFYEYSQICRLESILTGSKVKMCDHTRYGEKT